MFFNACCKMSHFACFQCEERMQDAYGLFYSVPVGFYINKPGKIAS